MSKTEMYKQRDPLRNKRKKPNLQLLDQNGEYANHANRLLAEYDDVLIGSEKSKGGLLRTLLMNAPITLDQLARDRKIVRS